MRSERWTMQEIRKAIATGRLKEPFRAADVNRALGITYAGTFLPKHRENNPGNFSVRFVQIGRGLYRLK